MQRHWLAALAAASLVCGPAVAAPPPDVAAQLRAIGPKIEVAKTSQIYSALLPRDLYAGVYATRDLAYGADSKQVLDVFTPAESTDFPKPVLVFVHGGGFVGGDKHQGSSPLYDNVVVWAAKHGVIGVDINYRLAPANTWPAGAEDVGLAVKWVEDNVARYGGDPKRIYLWGHSVGATHVADYLAHNQFRPTGSAGVKGAILSSGQIYDMTGPNVTKAYYGADESRYPEMAALSGLMKSRARLMVTSAELDPAAFQAQTKALEAGLQKAGRRPVTVQLPGHSHISEIYAVGTTDTDLSGPVLAFVTGKSAAH